MSDGCNNLDDKKFTAEHISTFSIIEQEGKKILHVVLKGGEKIDIQISTHVQELHDILCSDSQKLQDIIVEVLKWADGERKTFRQQYAIWDEEGEAAFDKRLDLPENIEAKKIFSADINIFNLHLFDERSEIKKSFSHGKDQPLLPYNYKDASALRDIQKLFKIIDAEKKGLLSSALKSLGSPDAAESHYGRVDIISKEWIRDHLSIMEKLFIGFERGAFMGENPIPYSQLSQDEKNLLMYTLMNRSAKFPENDISIQDGSLQEFDPAIGASLRQLGLKDELENLFGKDSNLDRRFYFSRFYEGEIPEKITEIVTVSREIYKKLRLLGLYYQDQLKIKTKDGFVIFTGGDLSSKSIDGKLYYKDHDEKYADNNGDTFFIDLYYGIEKDVYIPFTNLKIEDLSYGALKDVFALLGESGLAPAFYMILLTSMLPGLKASHKDNESLSNPSHSVE